ncbi:hypothetical protein EG835_07475, partial [bacterium]|nr:hypothetical protein [bacterium]
MDAAVLPAWWPFRSRTGGPHRLQRFRDCEDPVRNALGRAHRTPRRGGGDAVSGLNEDLAKDLTLEEFRRFRDLLHRQSGIYLEESKMDSLRISLVTRASRLGYKNLNEYHSALSRDETEFNELLNLVTINETSFFRFPGQFDALREQVLPEIMAGKSTGNRAVRIWSAGCS